MDMEIEKVKQEYEEKQKKKKKEKKKAKKDEEKDKGKKKEDEEDDVRAEKERDDKVYCYPTLREVIGNEQRSEGHKLKYLPDQIHQRWGRGVKIRGHTTHLRTTQVQTPGCKIMELLPRPC